MTGIAAELSVLYGLYTKLLELYEQLVKMGQGDQELIAKYQLEKLLTILHDKNSLFEQVEECQVAITQQQELLCQFFKLDEFSLKKLRAVAPARCQSLIEDLSSLLNRLVVVLEELEEHERIHAQVLAKYIDQLGQQVDKNVQQGRARVAYKDNYTKFTKS